MNVYYDVQYHNASIICFVVLCAPLLLLPSSPSALLGHIEAFREYVFWIAFYFFVVHSEEFYIVSCYLLIMKHKVMIIIIMSSILLLSGCIGSTENSTVTPSSTNINTSDVATILLESWQNAFGDDAVIDLDEENTIFYFDFKYDDFSRDYVLATEGDENAINSFLGLAEVMVEMSNEMQTLLPGYSIAVYNPLNKEYVIIVVKDGEVRYNLFE